MPTSDSGLSCTRCCWPTSRIVCEFINLLHSGAWTRRVFPNAPRTSYPLPGWGAERGSSDPVDRRRCTCRRKFAPGTCSSKTCHWVGFSGIGGGRRSIVSLPFYRGGRFRFCLNEREISPHFRFQALQKTARRPKEHGRRRMHPIQRILRLAHMASILYLLHVRNVLLLRPAPCRRGLDQAGGGPVLPLVRCLCGDRRVLCDAMVFSITIARQCIFHPESK